MHVFCKDFAMPELDRRDDRQTRTGPFPSAVHQSGFRHVMACVDCSPFALSVLAHAGAIADAMGSRLTVMRVLEPPAAGQTPPDPIEWDLRRREAQAQIARLVAPAGDAVQIETGVVEGPAAERICQWAHEHKIDLTVLGGGGNSGWSEWGLGSTARRVAESIPGSVMLVPAAENGGDAVRYRRLMVPLDGSSRAECALPVAIRIAEAHEAEVLLLHAVPDVGLTEAGPLEAEDVDLRDRLRHRNERVAQRYLNLIRARVPLTGTPTRIRLLPSGDPRHALASAVSDEEVDIIVLSSCGLSGHHDLPIGSTADFLMTHTATPILMVRGSPARLPTHRRRSEVAPRLRMPSRTLS
jgi:nucleotide-binding universal stress UspA family protein